MTDSLQELQSREYRKNVPAVKVMEGPVGSQPSFLYTIPLDNPAESADVIKKMLSQAMESGNVSTSVSNRVYLPNGQVLQNVHDESACAEKGCSIHHPSDNHMAKWSQNYRHDRGYMERICDHGLAHADLDDLAYFKGRKQPAPDTTHSCDGCCTPSRKQSKASILPGE